MKRPSKGHTVKQYAYAARKLNGQGKTKQEIALMVGYSPEVARNAKTKIESTEGYQNAVIELAAESHNVILSIIAEYKARGLSNFSNKDLNGAMNAIASAWEKFDKKRAPDAMKTPDGNPLRNVIMQKVENQTINVGSKEKENPTTPPAPTPPAEEPDLDF